MESNYTNLERKILQISNESDESNSEDEKNPLKKLKNQRIKIKN